jgi:hypothetical protein
VEAGAPLPEQDRPGIVQENCHGGCKHKRSDNHSESDGHEDIGQTLKTVARYAARVGFEGGFCRCHMEGKVRQSLAGTDSRQKHTT